MAYSEDVRNEVLKRLKDGEKVKSISEDTGVSAPTIYNWKKKMNDDNEKLLAKEKSKEIRELIKQRKYDEAKKICEQFPEDKVIQSQYITMLMRERNYEEAKKVCSKFPKYEAIQSQYITMLIREGNYEEAKKVCEQFPNNEVIQEKYKKILEREEGYEEEKTKNNLFLDQIKTRLYYDDIDFQFLDEIKQNDTDITEWEKTIVLLAIYEKQGNIKTGAKLLKNAKKSFAEEPEKVKELNKLQNTILTNKPRIFDWSVYDDFLNWDLNEKVYQEIMAEREKKAQEETEQKRKIEEQIIEERNKRESSKETKEKKAVMVSVKPKEQTRIEKKEEPKKVEKTNESQGIEKSGKTKKQQEDRIGEVLKTELSKLRGRILFEQRKIIFDDRRLHIPSNAGKSYQVPEEAQEELKQKYVQANSLIDDLDNLEIISQKSIMNLRAKMQMIMYLRKYGMSLVAEEKLKAETELYKAIDQMMRHRIYDEQTINEIKTKIEQLEGEQEYANQLLEKALSQKGVSR